ncbi:hypothetical protein CFT9_24364 [Pseudomonas sp. CFT9]|nr:hypothetical protein CFT9_24364 [Pseudomonas sp. CFT9]EPL12434.1 hypothetical protein CF150_08615 [Pseudomonas sp. CF150]
MISRRIPVRLGIVQWFEQMEKPLMPRLIGQLLP